MNGADPKTKASKIQNLVADGDLDQATKQLIIFAEDFSPKKELFRESINLSGQYQRLRKQERLEGSTDPINQRLSRIGINTLELVDDITDEYYEANKDLITESRASSIQLYSSSQINNRPPKNIDEENKKIERFELANEIWNEIKVTPPTSIVFEGTGISKIYKSKAIKFVLHPIDLRLKLKFTIDKKARIIYQQGM